MSFLKKLSEQVNDVGKKSKELMEISKLKVQIGKLELDRSGKFKELGKNVYISYRDNIDNDDKSIAICGEISQIEKQIHALEQEVIEKSAEKVTCSNCGNVISGEVTFCSKCGQQMKIIEMTVQEEVAEMTDHDSEMESSDVQPNIASDMESKVGSNAASDLEPDSATIDHTKTL